MAALWLPAYGRDVSFAAPWCFPVWGDAQLADETRNLSGDVDAASDTISGNSWPESMVAAPAWSVLSALATLGSVDSSIARAAEPHLDAMTILSQARHDGHLVCLTAESSSAWGVYAANPVGASVLATPTDDQDQWIISGRKLWCSLADRLSNALVSVPTEDGEQRLFAISLRDPSIQVYLSDWKAQGLRDISTGNPRVRTHCGRADGEDLLAACLDSVTHAVATAYRTRTHLFIEIVVALDDPAARRIWRDRHPSADPALGFHRLHPRADIRANLGPCGQGVRGLPQQHRRTGTSQDRRNDAHRNVRPLVHPSIGTCDSTPYRYGAVPCPGYRDRVSDHHVV
ncbi:hypothetical protein BH23ACT6_BH23ACT6_25500 [soil metagenome]